MYIIDANDAPKEFSYAAWKALVNSRLGGSKVFRERLIEVPWHLSVPFGIRDPDFKLEAHLPRVKLAAPGGMQA